MPYTIAQWVLRHRQRVPPDIAGVRISVLTMYLAEHVLDRGCTGPGGLLKPTHPKAFERQPRARTLACTSAKSLSCDATHANSSRARGARPARS